MELEKAIKIFEDKLNYLQARIVIAKDDPQSKKSYIKEMSDEKQAIETVLNYITILERATDNKYCYVKGGRTLYSRLKELEKEDLIKAYLRLRNETNQYIKENSIPRKKVEDKIKELEPELELRHLARDAKQQITLLQRLLEE